MDPPAPPVLVAENLVKRYGKITAVDDVTFRFEKPLIVGLVGPNGSGKTTLIRMLLGLAKPTQGKASFDGRPAGKLFRGGGPGVGYMPQAEAIYDDLTIRQNVRFFARIYRIPRVLRETRVDEAIQLVAMTERADDRIKTLSGGMRRRVSLACALVHHPRLLVLDEPTVGVDPELRVEMWDSFRRSRESGSLLVVSTHYMAEAGRCDVVVFMRRGHVLAADAPARLMKRTKTKDLEDAFLKFLEEGRDGESE